MRTEIDVAVQVTTGIEDLALASDLLLVATWSRTPGLKCSQVRPGIHITNLGADEPGKVELEPQLLSSSLSVTDDRRRAGPVLQRLTRA